MFLPNSLRVLPDVLSAVATALSAPLAPLDERNLAFQDHLNASIPWLWWPLEVPAAGEPMPGGAHVLYLAHAWVIARALRLPRRGPWTLATLLSWALFTGAWDRRAARTAASS